MVAKYPRVKGVITQQHVDISNFINEAADKYDFPPRLLVACGIMESGLDEYSERVGNWPDVSAGLFHQAVAWAPVGDQRRGPTKNNEVRNYPDNITLVFHMLKTDVLIATEIAAQQLAKWWRQEGDGLQALSRYNKPALSWEQNPQKENISRGWNNSAFYVVEEKEEESGMAEFQLGFKDLADKLGSDKVGKPITDEFNFGIDDFGNDVGRAQITSKGLMIWASGMEPIFLPAITE